MRDVYVQAVAHARNVGLQVIIKILPGNIRDRYVGRGDVVQQIDPLLADQICGNTSTGRR